MLKKTADPDGRRGARNGAAAGVAACGEDREGEVEFQTEGTGTDATGTGPAGRRTTADRTTGTETEPAGTETETTP